LQGITASCKLRPRDSNPEIQLQRLACCQLHQGATRTTKNTYGGLAPGSGAQRRQIAAGVGDLLLGSGDVDPVGKQAAGFGQVFGALDA
jgi:hypothetical protein